MCTVSKVQNMIIWHKYFLCNKPVHNLGVICSFIVFQIKFKLATVTSILFLLNKQHSWIFCYISLISRTLVSFVSIQLCVSKTKLNISKHAFSVAAPAINSQLQLNLLKLQSPFVNKKYIKYVCLKLLFPHTFLAVQCYNDDFCLPCF